MSDNPPPADVLRDGNIKATIWRRDTEKGPFFGTVFSRSYKDQDGNYRDTDSFSGSELLKVSELARLAYARNQELRREDGEERERGEHAEDRPVRRERFAGARQSRDQSRDRDR